jgi:hypothetical protein
MAAAIRVCTMRRKVNSMEERTFGRRLGAI